MAETNPSPEAASSSDANVERAEELVDAMTNTVSDWSARLAHRLLKRTALMREELEDIWAEAQTMSRERRGG